MPHASIHGPCEFGVTVRSGSELKTQPTLKLGAIKSLLFGTNPGDLEGVFTSMTIDLVFPRITSCRTLAMIHVLEVEIHVELNE